MDLLLLLWRRRQAGQSWPTLQLILPVTTLRMTHNVSQRSPRHFPAASFRVGVLSGQFWSTITRVTTCVSITIVIDVHLFPWANHIRVDCFTRTVFVMHRLPQYIADWAGCALFAHCDVSVVTPRKPESECFFIVPNPFHPSLLLTVDSRLAHQVDVALIGALVPKKI